MNTLTVGKGKEEQIRNNQKGAIFTPENYLPTKEEMKKILDSNLPTANYIGLLKKKDIPGFVNETIGDGTQNVRVEQFKGGVEIPAEIVLYETGISKLEEIKKTLTNIFTTNSDGCTINVYKFEAETTTSSNGGKPVDLPPASPEEDLKYF